MQLQNKEIYYFNFSHFRAHIDHEILGSPNQHGHDYDNAMAAVKVLLKICDTCSIHKHCFK